MTEVGGYRTGRRGIWQRLGVIERRGGGRAEVGG